MAAHEEEEKKGDRAQALPLLLLTAPPANYDGDTVECQLCGPFRRTGYEHAGHIYQERLVEQLKRANPNFGKLSKSAARKKKKKQKQDAANEDGDLDIDMPWDEFANAHVDLEDYYALLNLGKLEVRATPRDLQRAFKKASLVCHPDKVSEAERDEYEQRFKAMQKGMEILSDPVAKRTYDSTLPFDDGIPGDAEGTTDDTFYDTYRPVFHRNARFSVNPRVPELGDADTPYAEVDKFYDFWLSFVSWREFKVEESHDLDDADSRFERRWMERQNSKLMADSKKKEVARVRKLVEDAMGKDPRVRAHKQRVAEEKEARRAEKEAARQQREEEERLKREREEEEAARAAALAEEEKQRAKELRDHAKKLRKLVRTEVKAGHLGAVDERQVDELLLSLEHDELCELVGQIVSTPEMPFGKEQQEEAKQVLAARLRAKEEEEKEKERLLQEKLAAERLAARKKKERTVSAKEWSLEEESMLTRAVKRYPGGKTNRWKLITDMVNTVSGSKRKEKEIIVKVKALETGKRVDTQAAFDIYKKKMEASGKPLGTDSSDSAATATADVGVAPAAVVVEAKEKVSKGASKKEKEKEKAVEDEWSADQQAQLEKALRTIPKSDNRWDLIAEAVPGKTKKQCVARFKHIRAEIQKRKEAAAAK